jgi:hypothetical protein
MRVLPDYHRLRAIALGCWVIAAWWIVQLGVLKPDWVSPLLAICIVLLSVVLLALGVAFWLLGGDRRAGVVFDSKGLLLNLGSSASFVSWDNIERIGVSGRRSHWFALGSASQLGIRLRDPEPYIQSCEPRLPAAEGPLAHSLRWLARLIQPEGTGEGLPSVEGLARVRARTGYDILVPEAFLGGKADSFVHLVHAYHVHVR